MKIVIIGGNAAGMSAASKARRNDPQAEIVVIEKSGTVSYGACGLPYFISDEIKHAEDLLAVSIEDFRTKRKIDVRLFQSAESFDPRKKTVVILDGKNGTSYTENYDKLIIATGASAIMPDLPGKELQNIFMLRTLEDGIKVKDFIEKQAPLQATIIGAGYIGLEMAEALSNCGIKVRVVEATPQVLPYLDTDSAQLIADELVDKGVELHLGSLVTGFSGAEKVEKIHLADDRILDTDLAMVSVGIRPNTDLARSGGVQIGSTEAIQVDPRMQTNLRYVYAAGDCAESKCRVINKTTWVPLGTTANKQGKTAGDNVSGGRSKFTGITTTSAVKVFDLEAASTGLNTAMAEKLKLPFDSVQVRSKTRAHYYPGYKDIWVKLIFNNQSGLLLGAQIVGGEGVAKRIDILATALYAKLSVAQISELDLSYSPPFAPVWDVVLVAANQAIRKVRV